MNPNQINSSCSYHISIIICPNKVFSVYKQGFRLPLHSFCLCRYKQLVALAKFFSLYVQIDHCPSTVFSLYRQIHHCPSKVFFLYGQMIALHKQVFFLHLPLQENFLASAKHTKKKTVYIQMKTCMSKKACIYKKRCY